MTTPLTSATVAQPAPVSAATQRQPKKVKSSTTKKSAVVVAVTPTTQETSAPEATEQQAQVKTYRKRLSAKAKAKAKTNDSVDEVVTETPAPPEPIPFDPKSILPTTKAKKDLETLAHAQNKDLENTQVVIFACIDGVDRSIERPTPPALPSAPNPLGAEQEPAPTVKRDQFTAFGIPAYPTQAKFDDICYDFVMPGRRCYYKSQCYRIHPLDKLEYLVDAIKDSKKITQMRQDAIASKQLTVPGKADGFPTPKEVESTTPSPVLEIPPSTTPARPPTTKVEESSISPPATIPSTAGPDSSSALTTTKRTKSPTAAGRTPRAMHPVTTPPALPAPTDIPVSSIVSTPAKATPLSPTTGWAERGIHPLPPRPNVPPVMTPPATLYPSQLSRPKHMTSNNVEHWNTVHGIRNNSWAERSDASTSSDGEDISKTSTKIEDSSQWSDSDKTTDSDCPTTRFSRMKTSGAGVSGRDSTASDAAASYDSTASDESSRTKVSENENLAPSCQKSSSRSSMTASPTQRARPLVDPTFVDENGFVWPRFRPKTGVCRYWRFGECDKKYECKFAHPDLPYDDDTLPRPELPPPINFVRPHPIVNAPPPRFTSRPFPPLPQNSFNTPIHHRPLHPLRPAPFPRPDLHTSNNTPTTTPQRLPRYKPLSNETCQRWLLGRCPWEFTCKYVHHDLQYDPRPSQVPRVEPDPPVLQYTQTVRDHIRATFGAGFQVTQIVTGFESPWVCLSGLPDGVTQNQVMNLVSPFGTVVEHRPPCRSNPGAPLLVALRMSKPSECFAILTNLQHNTDLGPPIEVTMGTRGNANRPVYQTTSLSFQWPVPCINAWVGCETQAEVDRVLAIKLPVLRNLQPVSQPGPRRSSIGKYTVLVSHMPPDLRVEELREIFAPNKNVAMERYKGKKSATDLARGVRRLMSPYGEEIVDFHIPQPPYYDGKMTAFANFTTAKGAQEAASALNGKPQDFLEGLEIVAKHRKTLSFSLAPPRFYKVESDIRALQAELKADPKFEGTLLVITERENFFSLKLVGDDLKILGQLKSELSKLMNGDPVVEKIPNEKAEDGKVKERVVWDNWFMREEGLRFLRGLERLSPGVTIEVLISRRMLRLYGDRWKRSQVKQQIVEKLAERRKQTTFTIDFSRHIYAAFRRDTEDGLVAIREVIGQDNYWVSPLTDSLTMVGDLDQFTAVNDIINAFKQKHQIQGNRPNSNRLCPACLSESSTPIRLPCGHTWCRSCLQRYLKVSKDHDTTFPLRCHGTGVGEREKCGEPISLSIARDILPPADFEAILDMAVATHIQTHPESFRFCPTPDCQQIYRPTPENMSIFQNCPECLVRICSSCHADAHDGLSCSEVREGDDLFRSWAKENDVKPCPNCKMPIQKSYGCNHIECTVCHTHTCWVCMETFSDGLKIYGHMEAAHGGSGI